MLDPLRVHPGNAFKVVAIASSAGGLKALSKVLCGLPEDFPGAIAVVQHLSPTYASHLAEILGGRTKLFVKQAESGDKMLPGQVYIAPPSHHLLVNSDGILSLSDSPKIHFVRPSADVLFESVASAFQHRAIAVVLTGTGYDGATGVKAIKNMGGCAIATDEATSEHFSMPNAAINTGAVDFILPLHKIASTLANLAADRPPI